MHGSGRNFQRRRFTTKDRGKTPTALVAVEKAQHPPYSETIRARAKMATVARVGQSPVRWELSGEVFQHQAQPEASVLPLHFLGTLSDLPPCSLTSKTC